MNDIVFSRKQIAIAILIGLLALIARGIFFLMYSSHPIAGGDPTAFWSYAQAIASGQGFRSTFEPWLADRPPLYSYFLAGIFLLFGESKTAVFAVQAVLGALAASLFYLCASRLLDDLSSVVAGLLFAILPHFLLFTQQILTEAIYIPLWVFLLASLLFPNKNGVSFKPLLVTGILLGLLALVRREAVLPGSLIAVLLIWLRTRPDVKAVVVRSTFVFTIAGLVLLPWLARNYRLLGRPVLSSSAGVNFMVGNNPLGNGAYTPPPPDWQAQFQGLGELERDQKAWDLSVQWIKGNLFDFLHLLPKKFAVLWGPAHNLFLDGTDLLLIPLYILGLFRLTLRKQDWESVTVISLLPALTITMIGLIFVGGWRYRLMVYPGLLLLAGYGAMRFSPWVSSMMRGIQKNLNAHT